MNIIQDYIPKGRRNRPGRANPMKYITIHNTGNAAKGADAKSHAEYIKGDVAANAPVSWHYTVDEKAIYQHLPDNEDAFHSGDGGGDGNRKSIAIEICMNSDGDLSGATDKAAELTALLCKRHNISVENIVQHNKWSGKDCPKLIRGGKPYDWNAFINKVRAFLGKSTAAPTVENDKTIWNFLTGKGLNAYAVAGLMGNLYAESGLIPNNLQNCYEKSLGFTDATYTAAVDKGVYANFVKDGAGYGLAQWTYYTRKQALLNFAKAACASIGDMTMQLNFLWKELQGYTDVLSVLKCATSVRQASDVVLLQYERPADQSTAVQAKRAEYGQGYYNKFAGKTTSSPSKPALKSIDEIAKEVISGNWGNGQDRVNKLTAAGYDANAVQQRVNTLLK